MICRAEDIHKSYYEGSNKNILHVLKGVDLIIKKAEIVSITGISGSGKSTLLHILGTLDKQDKGEIYYQGKNIKDFSEIGLAKLRNKKIGFVFQFHYLLPEFTALENVALPAIMGSKNYRESIEKAMELLINVGLKDRVSHYPEQLSGGEQQRVAVARALINNPDIVYADEPTGNLDKQNSEKLLELIWNLNQKYEQAFLYVTHSEKVAARANKSYHLIDGKLYED
ncbi:MAG: lipoprotein-releasing system ATP-binding protein LolD [Candidatus Cloacimonadota bacterium]|nr:MAG: lipoprotein-releasing system ATP-binding protein LolD [Candidatus Cloacimonadota bacterium]